MTEKLKNQITKKLMDNDTVDEVAALVAEDCDYCASDEAQHIVNVTWDAIREVVGIVNRKTGRLTAEAEQSAKANTRLYLRERTEGVNCSYARCPLWNAKSEQCCSAKHCVTGDHGPVFCVDYKPEAEQSVMENATERM